MRRAIGVTHTNAKAEHAYNDFEQREVVTVRLGWESETLSSTNVVNLTFEAAEELYGYLTLIFRNRRRP